MYTSGEPPKELNNAIITPEKEIKKPKLYRHQFAKHML
jgi:hypothetical protein